MMKIFQQYWDNIVPNDTFSQVQFVDNSNVLSKQLIEELNENVANEDYQEMITQLHKIVVYMLFQEKEWQFVGLNQK